MPKSSPGRRMEGASSKTGSGFRWTRGCGWPLARTRTATPQGAKDHCICVGDRRARRRSCGGSDAGRGVLNLYEMHRHTDERGKRERGNDCA